MSSKTDFNLNFLFDKNLVKEESYKVNLKQPDVEYLHKSVLNLPEDNISQGKKSGNEENVKIKIILPILKFLGFDISNDLNFEERAVLGSIDITIRTTEDQKAPTVLLEAKYWKKDIDKYNTKDKVKYRSDVQQGLIYAAEMGIDWFIITNGFIWRLYKTHISGLVVYNYYEQFSLEELLDIDNLRRFYTIFSKDSLKTDLLNKLFSKTELLKESLNEQIYDILVDSRRILFDDLINKNRSIFKSEQLLMEIGQKILDRIVFIRFAEDNRLFNKQFLKNYRETWNNLPVNVKNNTPFNIFISGLFKNIYEGSKEDDIFPYNGGLFAPDDIIDKLNISNDVLVSIVDKMYFYENGHYIDFSIVPIDILGSIYEQYLSLSLIVKEQGSNLILKEENNKKIRKKFGIYYTPKYIVNFIIENTILSTLEQDINYLPNLTVLDPACGSGTFLSSAYDILYDKYLEYNEIVKAKSTSNRLDHFIEQMQHYKTQFDTSILSKNIFGVDLNTESVEITKMSLWFKTAQKNIPLNNLENRIKVGDSIIEDRNLSIHAFDWNSEFSDVFENHKGFDIIIGNPPYFKIGKDNPLNQTEDYDEIKLAGVNAAAVFINKSLKLLKNGGRLGLIVPKQLAFAKAWQKIREKLITNCKILFLVDCRKAFENVKLEQIILIIEKNFDNKENITQLGKIIDKNIIKIGEVPQMLCIKHDYLFLQYDMILDSIFQKINSFSKPLEEYAEITSGTGVNHLEKKGLFHPEKNNDDLVVIKGNDIQQFHLRSKMYFNKNDSLFSSYLNSLENPPKKKIVVQRIVAHIKDHIKITACFDNESSITYDTVVKIYPKDENLLWNILGIMNAKLTSFYLYKFIYNNAIRSMDFVPGYAKKTPIPNLNEELSDEITSLVREINISFENINNFNKQIQSLITSYGEGKYISLYEFMTGKYMQPLIDKKNINIKIVGTEIINNDILIIKINGKDIIKLEIKNEYQLIFLRSIVESIDIEELNKKEIDILSQLENYKIDNIINSPNLHFLTDKLLQITYKTELRKKINSHKRKIDNLLYESFQLTNPEIKYIEDSFL